MSFKISDLSALGGTFKTTDLFEISVDDLGGGFDSYKITGQELLDGIPNLGNADLTIDSAGTRKVILGGALSTDNFTIRNSADSADFLTVNGEGSIWANGRGGVSGVASNTAFGEDTFNASTTGNQSVAFGYKAGNAVTTGGNNTFVGFEAGLLNTTGNANTYVGYQTGEDTTTGHSNTLIGASAGENVTTGYQSTLIGVRAGHVLTTGQYSTALGYQALAAATGGGSIGVGHSAGQGATSGIYNNFLGNRAGYGLTTGGYNLFAAAQTVVAGATGITTGSYNTVIGTFTGLTNASNQVYVGDGQGNKCVTKDNNGNVYCGDDSALATTATNGFNYVRGGAGIPTGVPATSVTGHVPMYADTTNNKLYIYSGGSWVALN